MNFERRDGSVGTVRHHTGLIADGPPPPCDARLIVQVSRWDRLKDMAGVLDAFVTMASDGPHDAHLMLVGPDVTGVTDDPEGAAVFTECRARWAKVPTAIRQRIHLASIPMDDVDENAIIINALQRHAYLIVQKSLVEGFGLTVTEAMWKAKPVIASGVGGIQDQIVDERDGLLIADPSDLDAVAAAMARLLGDRRSPTDSVPPHGPASTTSSSATATSPNTSSSSQASARRYRSEPLRRCSARPSAAVTGPIRRSIGSPPDGPTAVRSRCRQSWRHETDRHRPRRQHAAGGEVNAPTPDHPERTRRPQPTLTDASAKLEDSV